jgi:hypothetical protein
MWDCRAFFQVPQTYAILPRAGFAAASLELVHREALSHSSKIRVKWGTQHLLQVAKAMLARMDFGFFALVENLFWRHPG